MRLLASATSATRSRARRMLAHGARVYVNGTGFTAGRSERAALHEFADRREIAGARVCARTGSRFNLRLVSAGVPRGKHENAVGGSHDRSRQHARGKRRTSTRGFDTQADFQVAIDRLLGLEGRELRVFDPDLAALKFNSPETRREAARFFSPGAARRRVYIVVHDTGHVTRFCPRLMKPACALQPRGPDQPHRRGNPRIAGQLRGPGQESLRPSPGVPFSSGAPPGSTTKPRRW